MEGFNFRIMCFFFEAEGGFGKCFKVKKMTRNFLKNDSSLEHFLLFKIGVQTIQIKIHTTLPESSFATSLNRNMLIMNSVNLAQLKRSSKDWYTQCLLHKIHEEVRIL